MTDLLIKQDEHLLEICFNRPEKKNSLTPEMLLELAATLNRYAESSQTMILIIRGWGDQFFSSGYDISRIPPAGSEDARKFATHKPLDVAVKAIEQFPFPTIALLNGSVYGGACELAFSCDFRYAAESTKMCLPPAKIGLVYSVEGLERIKNVIGISNLKKLIFTAGVFDTSDLEKFGAIDGVFPLQKLETEVFQLAETMGDLSPLSLKGHKTILNSFDRNNLNGELLKRCNQIIENSYASDDHVEGKKAFLEKRKANFLGR